jgi:hypothetical protein
LARRLEGLRGLLVPGSSMLAAWAGGPSVRTPWACSPDPDHSGWFWFNLVQGGAIVEAA